MRPQLAPHFAVLLAALALFGCPGGNDGQPQPDAGPTEAGTPSLRILPGETLDFGQVPFLESGSPITHNSLALVNGGSALLRIDRVEVVGPDGDELTVTPPSPTELLPRAGHNLATVDLQLRPASEGEKRWTLRIHSNDPVRPVVTVEVRANALVPPPCQLSVSPNRIQFPTLRPPEAPQVRVTLRNEGTAWMQQCLVRGVQLEDGSDPAVALVGDVPQERVLGPQEAIDVTLRIVAPPVEAFRPLTAALRFDVPTAPGARVLVPVQASVDTGSCIELAPADIGFADTRVGCELPARSFALYSRCSTDVVLRAIDLLGTDPSHPEFVLTRTPPLGARGYTVEPGAPPVLFQVRFRPSDFGARTAAVALKLGPPDAETTFVVSLYGNADGPLWNTDVFTQDERPQADLLLVLDNASSMADDQTSLATNLGSLLQYLKAADVDFQVGVVTADPADGTALRIGSSDPDAVLTRTTTSLDAQFAAKMNVGSASSAPPRCLEQAAAALMSPQNAALIRPLAWLSVICVTDTGDNSPLPVTTYMDDLWSVKGTNRKAMFTFNAVGRFGTTCAGDNGRLGQAVSLTNGVTAEVCDPDWVRRLLALGKTAFGPRSRFILTSLPDLTQGPIEVSIDGVVLPAVTAQGATAWTYDTIANAVDFEPVFVPEPGQTLVIRYPEACL